MIQSLLLKRIDLRPDRSYGALIGPQGPFIFTLELPWRENQPQVSCIPIGSWTCRRVVSPRWGETFDIKVPGRSLIRFHWGNTEDDTLGCVLTARTFDPVKGINGAVDSKQAFGELMATLKGVDKFTLHVINT
ncbi:MAG: hypothetical protein KIS74_03120 [Burkholderiales bacterium]|nr:hypothetical protein [Burkholderiales bacterium]